MNTIKFSMEFNTFHIDNKELNTNDISEKSESCTYTRPLALLRKAACGAVRENGKSLGNRLKQIPWK